MGNLILPPHYEQDIVLAAPLLVPTPFGRSMLQRKRAPAAAGGGITYQGITVNPSGAGNGVADLQFSGEVNTSSNFKDGFTIKAKADYEASYTTISSSIYDMAKQGTDKIRLTFNGTAVVDTWQGGHEFEVDYDDGVGGITGLTTFTLDQTYTNSADINLLNNAVAGYDLEEASGTRSDLIGSNDLTATNGPGNFAHSGNKATSLVNALDLDSSTPNDDLRTTLTTDWTLTGDISFTIALWAKFDTVSANTAILAHYGGAGSRAWTIWFNSSNSLRFRVSGDGTATTDATSGVTVGTGTWYHIVCTRDASDNNTRIRVDDTSEGSHTSVASIYASTSDVRVGELSQGSWAMDGQVDALAVVKGSVWTAAEITDHYNGGDGKQPPYLPV